MPKMSEKSVVELCRLAAAYGKYATYAKILYNEIPHRYFRVLILDSEFPISLQVNTFSELADNEVSVSFISSSSVGEVEAIDVNSTQESYIVRVGWEAEKGEGDRVKINSQETPYLHVELMRVALELYDKNYISVDTLSTALNLADGIYNREISC